MRLIRRKDLVVRKSGSQTERVIASFGRDWVAAQADVIGAGATLLSPCQVEVTADELETMRNASTSAAQVFFRHWEPQETRTGRIRFRLKTAA